MKKLTNKGYWDTIYENRAKKSAPVEADVSPSNDPPSPGKKPLSERGYFQNYATKFVWEQVFPRYLPKDPNLSVLEVGSAPGRMLIKFKSEFGYEPYGVEYTPHGVSVNRNNFVKNGIDPNRVIHADFFDPEFQKKYKETFDVVYSGGFIEHFDDVGEVIGQHLNLLKPGGYLVITIPNLRGFNKFMFRILHPEVIGIHNLSIMRLPAFKKLFEQQDVESLMCEYFGTYNIGMYNAGKEKFRKLLFRVLSYFQILLNVPLNLFLSKKGLDTPFFSPYLGFIGIKKETSKGEK